MPVSLLSAKFRGVRSYSPLESEAQTIEFMPLTLIVGKNGSGKTTIIEALKFIIAGEEPPLSDSRRNFIHTSKNPIGDSEKGAPYASVELKFHNNKNEDCFARREISRDTKGKIPPQISSSYKISKRPWMNVNKQDDWNRTIPKLFSLPNEAMLNAVVLCHQDANLWCMGESSSVKLIFDKIFGCEQYKKEIKHIDAQIKTCKSELELGQKDVLHDRDAVERKKKLTIELEELKSELAKTTAEADSLNVKIHDTSKTKESLLVEIQDIESKYRELDSLNQRASELNERVKSLKCSLREPFIEPKEVSDVELEMKMNQGMELVESSKKQQLELKKRESKLNNSIRELEMRRVTLQNEINKLKVIELKSKETEENLVKRLEDIKLEQSNDGADIDPTDIENSLKILEKIEKDLIQNKCDQAELEDNLSSKKNKLSNNLTNLEGIHQGLQHKIESKKTLVKELCDQLAQIDPMYKDLALVSDNLGKMSSITKYMPQSDFVNTLDSLIEQSTTVIDEMITKVKDESVAKLESEIKHQASEIDNCKDRIETVGNQKNELLEQQNSLEIEHIKVRSAAKEAHNKVMIFKNGRLNILSAFERYQQETKLLKTHNLEFKNNELKENDCMIDLKRTEVNAISLGYSKLTDRIGQSFEKAEEYRINTSIRDLLSKLKDINKKKSLSKDKTMDEIRLPELQTKLRGLEKQELELRDKRSRILGSRVQLERDLIKINHELGSHSKNNLKYAESLGKVVCNQIVIGDLEKLKICFQQSITSFHNHMILRINEVLKARWRQIYQGSDIDLIELVDEEITRGKDKKAFNYHIAMRKGGLRMKMREKSSAGQKALASIILRMTLAELFVKDFAFIALDEPTANLDIANVKSLAKAIGLYVKRRAAKGVNIQWIIITHDELFLRSLDAECSPYYYQVNLDSSGYSKITKIPYQDLPISSQEGTQ